MASFQTKAPFAKAASSSDPKFPHKQIPGGIEIGSWVIKQTLGPILNSTEVDQYAALNDAGQILNPRIRMSEALNLPSLPEMVFGKNKFELFERSSGFRLEFTALDALKMVSHQPPHDIKVAASSVWSESNKGQVAKLKQNSYLKEEDSAHQDFDWTFTTAFSGLMTQLHPSTLEIIPGYAPTIASTGLDAERDGIPMAKLRSTSEPILWFSHVHLFEDELHDNGIAEISTKARVMGTFWFCLVRFWLRVDGVMFRVIDHRLYHEFGSSHIIKETTTKEGSWDSVTQKVEGDLKKIKDPSEFSNHLATISSSLEHIKLPSSPSS